MKWIRLWVNETFQSTTFQELTTSERGVWYSLLIMAGMNLRHPGVVELRDGIPYPDYIMPTILNCSMDEWTIAKEKLIKVDKITLLPDGRIKVTNWKSYQTEYERYRKTKRLETNIGHSVGYSIGHESTTDTDTDTDTDTEGDKDIYMSKKTPFREKLLPLFLLEWSKTHEGSCTMHWERDGTTAKKLWNQCRKDDPINPLKFFENRMRLVMSGRIIDNFSALLSFWNTGARKATPSTPLKKKETFIPLGNQESKP